MRTEQTSESAYGRVYLRLTEPDQSRVKGEDQMIAFLLQSAMLLLAAYFAGRILGCMVRRTFFAHTLDARSTAARPIPVDVAVPAASPAPHPGSGSGQPTRFERALTGLGRTGPQRRPRHSRSPRRRPLRLRHRRRTAPSRP